MMSVMKYLEGWGVSHLRHKFKGMLFETFLGIPYSHTLTEYGEHFARKHNELCETLQDILTDRVMEELFRDHLYEGDPKTLVANREHREVKPQHNSRSLLGNVSTPAALTEARPKPALSHGKSGLRARLRSLR
ncbi:hypothetical protein ATANTOWER_000989 [Ataeniobius toweri]|uniref:Uncharacterized protein n=1 Tax=Ataeniobius toweri TaxID=208326 RepID=A0ABU7BZ25_9TELE|nr:hypothetical protein [Ataeniobius toweri]